MIWTFILLENAVKFRFRKINSEICASEFGTSWTKNRQWKVTSYRHTIRCRFAIWCCRMKTHCLQTLLRQNRTTSKRPGTWGTSDLRSLETNKIRTFNDLDYFFPMLIVAPLTSRTNDARSSDAEQRLWKHVGYKNALKFALFESELVHWLATQMINKMSKRSFSIHSVQNVWFVFVF